MSILYQKTNSTLEALEPMINARLYQINTAFPAKVVETSGSLVSVQPLIKSFYADTEGKINTADYPIIPDLPIMSVGNARSTIRTSVLPGDIGIVIICQADIESIFKQGSEIDSSHRKFDVLDGLFIPITNQQEPPIPDIEIKGSSIQIKGSNDILMETETLSITNTAGGDLISILVSALNAISALVTSNGETLNGATIAAIQAEITKLETFV